MNEMLPEGPFDTPTFNSLDDEKFEGLVLELIRRENKSGKAHRLGPGPVSQQGYDIEAVLDDGTKVCCECKQRAERLDSKELTNAVSRFLRGTKLSWADQFWLVTSAVRSRTSDEAERMAQHELELLGKKFLYMPREELWARLKYQPELVFNYIGEHWGQISLAWTQKRLAESREEERRKEERRIFSRGGVDTYEDGYLSLTFLQPDVGESCISALFRFKTDGLDQALIALSNDDVLDAFDEPMWPDEKPLMVSKHAGSWAQIGNVRLELTQRMLAIWPST
jgi:hypothetical protein